MFDLEVSQKKQNIKFVHTVTDADNAAYFWDDRNQPERNKKKQTIQPIINTDRNNNNACL